jgi:Excalibur calcium-binding domain
MEFMQLRVSIIAIACFTGTTAAAAESGCHPSYEGKCVPIASDVDCAGGRGKGPVYVEGPVIVVGPDEYELDRDGDGIACEPEKKKKK